MKNLGRGRNPTSTGSFEKKRGKEVGGRETMKLDALMENKQVMFENGCL